MKAVAWYTYRSESGYMIGANPPSQTHLTQDGKTTLCKLTIPYNKTNTYVISRGYGLCKKCKPKSKS